jgi:beta-N-acetylhexosaminidase
MKQYIIILFVLSIGFRINSQKISPAYFDEKYLSWADSIMATMTVDEKIGQLLMPRGNYSGKSHDVDQLKEWVMRYKIGGLALFATHPMKQVKIVNELQALSRIPLWIGQDFEWGLGMRLDSADRIHYNMTLGAVTGNDVVFEKLGKEIGKQCRRVGVHVNYGPVVDVNNNPDNPVINFRSFGSNKEEVVRKGLAIMKGIQSERIVATAKHFPGHGDTDTDSHYDLPLISHNVERLRSVELYPFQKLIDHGLTGIMSAHLNIPALDKSSLASTFSESVVTNLLRGEMGYQGLVFTDAMDMQGAVKNFPKGEAMVRAILAGNDVLETFTDVPVAFEAIQAAVQTKVISMDLLDAKVRKILAAKAWVGLGFYCPVDENNLMNDLRSENIDLFNRELAEESITCLINKKNLLPIKDLTKKTAVLSIGSESAVHFVPMVRNYKQDVDQIIFSEKNTSGQIDSFLNVLNNYEVVIAGIHFTDIRAGRNYGLTPAYEELIKKLIPRENIIFNVLGNVFILKKIPELANANALLVGYQQNSYLEEASAQIIFGALACKGKLPVDINDFFKEGLSVNFNATDRLAYGIPGQEGMDNSALAGKIDSLVISGLEAKAYPGAVVSVAYKGRVIYQKAYGDQVYNQQQKEEKSNGLSSHSGIDEAMDNVKTGAIVPVTVMSGQSVYDHNGRLGDIYDLASITKVAASALSIMYLSGQDKFNYNESFSEYFPLFEQTNKANLTYKNMLTHRSGLTAWIPFWRDAVDTISMIALISGDPNLSEKLYYDIKKRKWIGRLLGYKPKKILNIKKTFEFKKSLMEDALKQFGPQWKDFTFSEKQSGTYPYKVHDQLYMHKDMPEILMQSIAASPVNEKQGYVYSDLHYYTYPEMIKDLTGQSFEKLLYSLYAKIGAQSLTFNPLNTYKKTKIVPTEYDSLYRKVLIHGYVHDEGASMMDGVSGHAGLFGNANDLTKLMQMYLQKGKYGGEEILKGEIIDDFTQYKFPEEQNRRGIAFDKKDFNPAVVNGPVLSSDKSYGHSGFTGTFTWVDPEYDMVYVFLSNRVYPTRNNNLISTMNIRTKLGDIIIGEILKSKTSALSR